MMIYYGNDGS